MRNAPRIKRANTQSAPGGWLVYNTRKSYRNEYKLIHLGVGRGGWWNSSNYSFTFYYFDKFAN